jgi:hypothetical protein
MYGKAIQVYSKTPKLIRYVSIRCQLDIYDSSYFINQKTNIKLFIGYHFYLCLFL